jgi:hypothetical protein
VNSEEMNQANLILNDPVPELMVEDAPGLPNQE